MSNYEVSELLKEVNDLDIRGKYRNALRGLEHILELDPNNAQGLYKKAIIYGKCKEYEKAIKYLNILLETSTFNDRKEALLLKS